MNFEDVVRPGLQCHNYTYNRSSLPRLGLDRISVRLFNPTNMQVIIVNLKVWEYPPMSI